MIQRYDFDEKLNTLAGLDKYPDGRYVLFTDHLAALEATIKEKDNEIVLSGAIIESIDLIVSEGTEPSDFMMSFIPVREVWDKVQQIAALTAERSDAWALAFNLWPGQVEPSELDLCGVIHELSERYKATLSERDKEIERLKEQYHDLLYQVEKKYPDESRHETAKRFIRAYQNIDCGPKQYALKEASHE